MVASVAPDAHRCDYLQTVNGHTDESTCAATGDRQQVLGRRGHDGAVVSSLSLGLCQCPCGAMSLSAWPGPQLPGE